MIRGGAPCVTDCYMGYFDRFIAEQQLSDIFLFSPGPENNYGGFDLTSLSKHLLPTMHVADILVEIEQVLRVVSTPESVDELRGEWQRFRKAAHSFDQFQAEASWINRSTRCVSTSTGIR